MFTSFTLRFLRTIKVWIQIQDKKNVWQIFPWFFCSPDYITLWIVKVFNLGAFYVLSYVFLYLLEFSAILNLQNSYTDGKIIKVSTKRTEANVKKFGLLDFVSYSSRNTLFCNQSFKGSLKFCATYDLSNVSS